MKYSTTLSKRIIHLNRKVADKLTISHFYNRKNYSNDFDPAINNALDSYFVEKVVNDKNLARIRFLEKRNRLAENDVKSRSKHIASNLISHRIFKKSRNIALYIPIKNEVETSLIHQKAIDLGKMIYYPLITGDHLTFHKVDSLLDLKIGKFGIYEPCHTNDQASLDTIDLFVHPGLCFDLSGNRIGYGKGFYDRTLRFIIKDKKVGLAYSFQIVDMIKTDSYDAPLGYIATENHVFKTNDGGYRHE